MLFAVVGCNPVPVTASTDAGSTSTPNDDLLAPNGWVCPGTPSWASSPAGTAPPLNGDQYIVTTYTSSNWAQLQGTVPKAGACGGLDDGTYLYIADKQYFGCGAHVRITNPLNGKSCVAIVDDEGPAWCVEYAAGGAYGSGTVTPVAAIDASPLLLQNLGITNSGWKAHVYVDADATDDPVSTSGNCVSTGSTGQTGTGSPQPFCSTGVNGTAQTCQSLQSDPAATCQANSQGNQTCCVSDGTAPTTKGASACCSNNALTAAGVCASPVASATAQPTCNVDPGSSSCQTLKADPHSSCQPNAQGNEVCCVADGLAPGATLGANACCALNGLSEGTCKAMEPIATGAVCSEDPDGCIPTLTGLAGDSNTIYTSPATCNVRPDGKQICCIPNGALVPGGIANTAQAAQLCCSYSGDGYVLDNGSACQAPPAGATVSPCASGSQTGGHGCPGTQECQPSGGVWTCR